MKSPAVERRARFLAAVTALQAELGDAVQRCTDPQVLRRALGVLNDGGPRP